MAALTAVAAVVAIIRSISPLTTLDLNALNRGSLWLLAGILLLTPDLVRLLTSLLSPGRSVSLAARRLMESDRGRYAVAATALACCIGVPTVVATFVATETRSRAVQDISQVPEHHIDINVGNSNPTTASTVADIIAATPGVQPPVAVSYLSSPGASIRFATDGEHGAFGIWVVSSPDELDRVLDGRLTEAASDALTSGGVVDWSDADGVQRLSIQRDGADPELTDPLPTAKLDVDPAYEFSAAGAMLRATANQFGFTTDHPSLIVFTDLDDSTIRTVVDEVTSAGYDARFAAYHVLPPPTRATAEWYAAGTGLTLAGFLVLWTVNRGQARHLRNYAARLLAIGLPRSWSTRVLLTQTGLTLIVGITAGLAAGAIPIAIFADSVTAGIVLDIPIGFIAMTVATSIGAALLSSITALLTIRASSSAEHA